MEEAARVPPVPMASSVFSMMDVSAGSRSRRSSSSTSTGRASNRVAAIRALEEQAAYGARGHLAIIEELTGRTYDEIVFTGGAAKGLLWPQIVADVLGVAVRVPVVKESTALGAAIYAGLGGYAGFDEVVGRLVRFERTFEPDPATTAEYDEHYARWAGVYHRILDLSETGLLKPMWWPAGA
jgi:autoinducer 2 (AI-2) kinase